MDSTQGDGAASSRPFLSSLISKKGVSDSIPSTKNDTPAPAPSPAPLPVAPSNAIEPLEPVPNVDILTQTVAMSMKSLYLYGIYGIEIWCFNEGSGKLENIALSDDIEGGTVEGLLLKRVTQDADEINRKFWNVDKPQESFKKLTDKSNKGYLAPDPVGPGCGLPGALWSEIGKYATNGLNGIGHSNVSHDVHWREVDELADDPDQPYDDRLQPHITHAIIDTSVSVIDQYAFQDCQRLLNVDMVEFGDVLERIEHMAFDNCNSLIRIAMPLDCTIDVNAFYECPMLIAINVVGVIRKSISSLHMERWRNEMNLAINWINKELTLSSASTDEKPQVIEQWIQTVLRRMEDYRTRHYIVVKEAMTLLELALWKAKLDGSRKEDSLKEPKTKRAKIDFDTSRQERRVTCGAAIIIKNVLPFLQFEE